jgi:hypothetical protein
MRAHEPDTHPMMALTVDGSRNMIAERICELQSFVDAIDGMVRSMPAIVGLRRGGKGGPHVARRSMERASFFTCPCPTVHDGSASLAGCQTVIASPISAQLAQSVRPSCGRGVGVNSFRSPVAEVAW